MISSPKVSVVMSVYNSQSYLKGAIESILNQTYQNFEFLIIDDGSTDESDSILHSFSDPRIKIIPNKSNLGLATSLNKGLKAARGKYIARMDADDISLPHRIKNQVDFLENHTRVGVVGTWIQYFDDFPGHVHKLPTDPNIIRCWLLFDNTIAHPTVMMRSDMIKNNHLEYDDSLVINDYELWIRSAQYFDISNIGQVLLLYRRHGLNMTSTQSRTIDIERGRIHQRILNEFGIRPTKEEQNLHRIISTQDWGAVDSVETAFSLERWLIKIMKQNEKSKYFHQESLKNVLSIHLFLLCNGTTQYGIPILKKYFESDLRKYYKLKPLQLTKFVIKSFLKKQLS